MNEVFEKYINKLLINKKEVQKIEVPVLEDLLTGELIIQDYPQLEELLLVNHALTSLKVVDCPNLKKINVRSNQLTKLEITNSNQLVEIIANQNQLESLIFDCPVKRLMLADNPLLAEIKVNLSSIKELNITNTLINLDQENEELKAENKRLYEALNKTDEIRREGKLFSVEPIQTPKQAEEAIQRHLKKVEMKLRNHFEGKKEDPVLETWIISPVEKRKVKEVLTWIIEAQVDKNYQKLVEKWNGGLDYKVENDFDGSLDTLIKLIETKNYTLKNEKQTLNQN